MRIFDSGRVQDKLIRGLERQGKKQAFQRDKYFRFKLLEIHNKLSQTLLMEKIIESDNPAAISDALLKGLKKALNSTEFDLKYFIAPIRNIVSRPNPYSLYVTQYILEVLINDPHVIEIYGTDLEIYGLVNQIFSQISVKFDMAEQKIIAQLESDKSLVPGSREYEIALDELMRKQLGEPQK